MTAHRYLTAAEAAEILRVSVKTIYRRAQAGELVAVKDAKLWLIDANSLPSPDGPRRLPPPRPRKYGAPGTISSIAAEVKASRAVA